MDKVRELENRLQEALREDLDLSVIGYNELDATWRTIDEIKNEANEVISDLIVGSTRDENGRFISKDNMTFDVDEIAAISAGIKEITDKAYARISVINAEERRKKDLFADKFASRRNLRESIRTNDSMIRTLEAEIKSIKTQLGDPGLTQEMIADLASRGIEFKPSESSLSPERRYYLENELKAKEASLQSFKDANDVYKHQEEKLTSEMEILRNGGKLEEVLEEEKTEEKVDEKAEEKTEEKVEEQTPIDPILPPAGLEPEEKKKEGEGVIPPILPPEKIDTHEMGEEPDEFPIIEGEEKEDEEEKGKDDTPIITPILPPDKIETDDLKPEDDETEEKEDEEEEEKDDTPIPVPVEEEEEEEYEKTAAKPSLWKKVGKMLVKAAAFISILGTAIHTGMLVNQGQLQHKETLEALNRIGQVQVDEEGEDHDIDGPHPHPYPNTTVEEPEQTTGGKTPSNGDDKVDKPVSPNPGQEKPTPDPDPTPVNPDPTPVNPDPTPVNPDPDPVKPDPDPVKPDPGDDDKDNEKDNDDDMHLNEGDGAYNEKNGIYVDSEGNTYKINPDGSLTKLDDQELDHNKKGESIVGEDELNPEIPKEMPVIGNVITGDNMTEDEIKAADDMINSNKSPEDLLDENVSEKNAEEATANDYTQAQEDQEKYEEKAEDELKSWWNEITNKLDAANEEENSLKR